jgi:hypothetical protein
MGLIAFAFVRRVCICTLACDGRVVQPAFARISCTPAARPQAQTGKILMVFSCFVCLATATYDSVMPSDPALSLGQNCCAHGLVAL